MGLGNNYQKFKKHLRAGGLLYAFWRGIKYLNFLITKHFITKHFITTLFITKHFITKHFITKLLITKHFITKLSIKKLLITKHFITKLSIKKLLIKKQKDGFKLRNYLLRMRETSVDILLIQCPPWDDSLPPLGIAYLSSYLKKYGYRTNIFDLNISLYHLAHKDVKYLWEQKSYDWWVDDRLFKKIWSELREITNNLIYEVLKKTDMECIGLSVNFASIKFASEMIKIIKSLRSEVKLILGGWGCINEHMRSLFPKDLVDVFVVGEGEETLKETIEAFRGHRKTSDVLGAIFNKETYSVYKPRSPIMDLNSIPWPAYEDFPLSAYTHRVLPLFTSRGCISRCAFCNDWSTSKPYRYRTAKNIFDEIKYHKKYNRYNHFSFKDLLCNGNINELNKLCDLMIESNLNIQWDSQAICREEMTPSLLYKLKKAGCKTLIYGIESFSDNVLKKMGKLFTRDVAEKVLRDTHMADIDTYVNLIVGFPGETEDDFKETLEAVERNHEYISQIGAVSVCLINAFTDLEINSFKYRLLLSQDPNIRAKKWRNADGDNTYEMRRKKAEELLALIKRLDLSLTTLTI